MNDVEVQLIESIWFGAAKRNSKKKKIDAIMIIRDNEEVVIDLKQVYNKEYNDF